MLTGNQIRNQFITFFKDRGHNEVKSSPVVPIDDPTLLFANAGMNQFKDIFLGKQKADIKRAVNSQKCIRAGGKHNDLDEVGKDGLHHTFFEMLGNWSFGDYYKKEAILWAWELLTAVWKIDKDRLYATVHETDEEAYQIWENETDIAGSHISYQGDKDNFWEMGETGPCGPCSEIHYDIGYCDRENVDHVCTVNGKCNRYIEIWNLVFIQFFRDSKGALSPLANRFVDTGAGFERLCLVLQNKRSNYETDLFLPIIREIEEISKQVCDPEKLRGINIEQASNHLVIADHIRMLCVALADGAYPSNEGRGYTLRRVLRRASRYGRLLGLHEPFLYRLTGVVVATLGGTYPEVAEKEGYIKTIIRAEEERFNLTLDKGLEIFEEICGREKGRSISGKNVFLLYDTYGFPPDLTAILAREKGKEIDEEGFDLEMKKQRKLAQAGSNFKMKSDDDQWIDLSEGNESGFVGYSGGLVTTKVLKYSPLEDGKFKLVLEQTPFYAESGGQVADKGFLFNDNDRIEIYDVRRENSITVHYGKIIKGSTINEGDYTAQIDTEYRQSIARNHTATHLLHAALKDLLGSHVQQKGSLVAADHLRFDFTHFNALQEKEVAWLENIINSNVRSCQAVITETKSYTEAKEEGAVALFGEKYEEVVRTIKIGEVSLELCGGTHVNNTGEIGFFKIHSETASASGIRRIEAVTGSYAEKYVKHLEDTLNNIAKEMKTPLNRIIDKVVVLLEENKSLAKQLAETQVKDTGQEVQKIIQNAIKQDDFLIASGKLTVNDASILREMGDILRDKLKHGVGVLAVEAGDKASFVVVVTKDLTDKLKAGSLASKLAAIVGGKGGGRPDMAMAGGKDIERIEEALRKFRDIVVAEIGKN